MWVLGTALAITFCPVILYFIYNTIRDPLTPTLITNGWEYVKTNYFGYLGDKKKAKEKKVKSSL